MSFVEVLDDFLIFMIDYGIMLLIISFLFCLHMKKRSHFALRAMCVVALFVGVTNHWHSFFTLAGMDIFGHWPIWSIGSLSFAYVAIYLLASLVLWFCFDERFSTILYFSAGGYAVQHFAAQMYQFFTAIGVAVDDLSLQEELIKLLIYAVTFAVSYYCCILRCQDMLFYPKSRQRVAYCVVSVIIVSLLSNWSNNLGLFNVATYIYSLICCVLLLYIQFSMNRIAVGIHERETMERLILEKSAHMEDFERSVQIINTKCHDLRKQLDALRSIGSKADRDRFYDEVSNSIDIYESSYDTGNRALDAVLTEKALLCKEMGINLKCIADGALLAQISTIDCYSLFENLLSNAMEALALEEPDQREIRLLIVQREGFISISMENTCTRPLHFEDGMPVSTKGDALNHGFGTKSIRYIVKKYDGNLVFRQKDGLFCASVLFPIRKSL